jgi:hypothetical protein
VQTKKEMTETKITIDIPEEYIEKLYEIMGYEDSELDDELDIQDAILALIDEKSEYPYDDLQSWLS